MATNKINIYWNSFKGLRRLNSINSATELGADIISNVSLSKEKSGQQRSIKTSGYFEPYIQLDENVIELFHANLSGYSSANQLIAFTKTTDNINAWIVEDDNGKLFPPIKIAEFPIAEDIYDITMTQFGDRLVMVCCFGNNTLGFVAYSATTLTGWTQSGTSSFYYRVESIVESTTGNPVDSITQLRSYGSRLAINGKTTYVENSVESIYGIWFSEAGNPIIFTKDYITSATDTSAFFSETGEYVSKLVEYNGLTCFCRSRSYNITGSTQNNITVGTLTAKGVVGNGAFVINGKCGYIDSYSRNIFTLTNNIDGTIGFDSPIGDDIREFLNDINRVSIFSNERKVYMIKPTGESLILDIDIMEWTINRYNPNTRGVSFLNKVILCDGTSQIYLGTENRTGNSILVQDPKTGYYSYFKTNLIWLDSQSSVKSHIYPFGIILEQNSNNNFFVRYTVDRKKSYIKSVIKAGVTNGATYSANDNPSLNNSYFVDDDNDTSGRVFVGSASVDIMTQIDNPPFWRYLEIEIYTDKPTMEFNISSIEAKQTFITDEQLDY